MQPGEYYIHAATAFPNSQFFEVNFKKITINRNNLIGCGIFRKEAVDSVNYSNYISEKVINTFSITPNPTNSKVHLTTGFEGSSQIVLTDLSGKELQTYTTEANEIDIDLSGYSDGMYFFRISNRLGSHIAKVMLSKN